FLILFMMMIWFRTPLTWVLLVLPLFLLLCVTTALAVSLWLSALCVKYRDVGLVIPFLMQVWMYVSPVAYPVSVVPERWRMIYGLNPMAGVIEGFRWTLLRTQTPDFRVMAVSAAVVLILLFGGTVY